MKKPVGRAAFWVLGLILGLSLVVLLPGWFSRPDVWANQPNADQLAGALDREHAMEQTFTAGRDDLAALDLFASVPPGRFKAEYALHLTLFQGERALAAHSVLLSALQKQPRIHFPFPVQPHSAHQTYRLRIQSDAPADTVSLLGSRDDGYADGQLRLSGVPVDRDLAFRAFSALTLPGLASSARAAGARLLFLLAATLALALVGAALLVLIGAIPGAGGEETWLWCLGAGMALSIAAFLLLGLNSLWALALILVLGLARGILQPARAGKILRPAPPHGSALLRLLLLLGWSLLLRLIQVEDLSAPLWVDGLRHGEMIERMLEAGGGPGGLLYHIGFHSLVVLFTRGFGLLSGAALAGTGSPPPFSVPEITLITGQWIGALSGLTLYPFARRVLGGSPAGALAATLVYSLLSVVPTYGFNWGRYPFELGLLFLPLVLAAGMAVSDRIRPADGVPGSRGKAAVWGAGALFLLLSAGMVCAHYGTLAFLISFLIVWLLSERPAWLRAGGRWGLARGLALGVGAILLLGSLMFLRFGPGVVAELSAKLQTIVADSMQANQDLDHGEILQLLGRGSGWGALLAGGVGLVFAALRGRRVLALTAGWFCVQALWISIQAPVLGYALASYTNLLLALSLPLSVLAGFGFLELGRALERKPLPSGGWAVTAGVALAVAGGLTLPGLLNGRVVLYGPQDAAALRWITENTPADAVFLVNSNHWGASQVVASDGGGWIPILASRKTVFFDHRPSADVLVAFRQEHESGYIFLGRFPGFLSADLLAQGAFQKVYDQDGIKIYRW